MRPPIISFEQAQDHIVQQVLHAEQKPYLALLFGNPNSGKSTLAKRCRDNLYYEHNLMGITPIGRDSPDDWILEYARDFMLIEDIYPGDDINSYLRRLFSRDLDLTILLTPSVSLITPQEWEYFTNKDHFFYQQIDYIVENPLAKVKRL